MTDRCVFALLWVAVAGCAFEPAGASGIDDGVDADVAPPVDAPVEPPAPVVCPAGYAPIGESQTQYRIVEVNVTWAAAAADCNDDGASTHLVVVGNAVEKAALTNQFSGNTWVGLSDAAVEGTFAWVTNEPTHGFPIVGERPPWDAGDPDGGAAENCVRFKNSFDFEDKPCGELNSYVCECDGFSP